MSNEEKERTIEDLRLKILDAWTESEHEDVRAADYVLQGYIIGPLAGVAAQVALREAKPADSIVIPRADLPEVRVGSQQYGHEKVTYYIDGAMIDAWSDDPEAFRRNARRNLALAEHLDAKPRPLAVGDRVRVVTPEYAGGTRNTSLAVGDVGEVVEEAAMNGEIVFHREGTRVRTYIAAANVERIEEIPDGAILPKPLNIDARFVRIPKTSPTEEKN